MNIFTFIAYFESRPMGNLLDIISLKNLTFILLILVT